MTDAQRIAELESQLAAATAERILTIRLLGEDYSSDDDRPLDSLVGEALAQKDNETQQLTAVNAALLEAIRKDPYRTGNFRDVCIFCDHPFRRNGVAHEWNCILVAEHPGSQLLERLEAADRLQTVAQKIQTEIYPREIFVGCDECCNETCECDRGVQITRQLTEALDACTKAKEPI